MAHLQMDVFFASMAAHCDNYVAVWHVKDHVDLVVVPVAGLVVKPDAADLGVLCHYFVGRM